MTELTLYSMPSSGNSYKVRLLLTQLGLVFERVEMDIFKGETRTPDFLARNPNGRIPTLRLEDGSYLAELLLEKGYEVHGLVRRSSTFGTERIDHIYRDPHKKDVKMKLHYGDLTDSSNLNRLIEKIQPDEIYNLGVLTMFHAFKFISPLF